MSTISFFCRPDTAVVTFSAPLRVMEVGSHVFWNDGDDLQFTLAPGRDPRGYYRDLREQGVLETLWENR